MLSEHKVIDDPNNVFLVIRVVSLEVLQNLALYETLLVQSLLVPKDFACHELLFHVVEAAKDLAKTSLSDPFDNLIAEVQVVMNVANVLALVVVKPIVFDSIGVLEGGALPLKHVDVVDEVFLQNLLLFALEQVLAQMHEHLSGLHGKLNLELLSLPLAVELVPPRRGPQRGVVFGAHPLARIHRAVLAGVVRQPDLLVLRLLLLQ